MKNPNEKDAIEAMNAARKFAENFGGGAPGALAFMCGYVFGSDDGENGEKRAAFLALMEAVRK